MAKEKGDRVNKTKQFAALAFLGKGKLKLSPVGL
jgi:hypothetical protein